ncbi:amidase [Bordetella genomosp. 5]|uniref:Amidase domain-containing protein n=1 Tax=Bordetella genomosp. 5 TaxID=1395608 RepID=A0A261TYE7_9BORD|nr:amidase [Bordetella genomosp. 5]OZI53643.1 hypothetical protein CAL25_06625 [Bordetella genomosp. 5]
MNLPTDPVGGAGLAAYGRRLRAGQTTVVDTVQAYLERIGQLDDQLRAYTHVDADSALRAAAGLDALLAGGIDLGPLMGVPVAVKDVLAVTGMPTRVGSDVEVDDLVGVEGGFVGRLRRAGCVILGKTQTVEFALGSAGTNYRRGTPRNPMDSLHYRVPGGSSSGSAVAVAAGLCAMAVGTDTGGSVRGPAAFCGIFGMKFGRHMMPHDGGMFSMSRSFDSLGLIAPRATDVALAWGALSGQVVPSVDLGTLKLGLPQDYFFDGIDPRMAACLQSGLDALVAGGVRMVPFDIPALRETDAIYSVVARHEAIAMLGRERFTEMRAQLNPDVAHRLAAGLEVSAARYEAAQRRRQTLLAQVHAAFHDIAAWIAPAKQHFPPIYPGDWPSGEAEEAMERSCLGPTRPANVFDLCASAVPLGHHHAPLPAALQLLVPAGQEARLLGMSVACEAELGPRGLPDMSRWLRSV